MIPKIIHAVWVGGKPLTKMAQDCMKSWKKYCPDYEIKIWNESNFDINQNMYCKQAYECKKWAFVSDYIRFKVLYDYGGIYMDLDVEVIKPLDKFLIHPAFSGFENKDFVAPGLILGAEKGNVWIKKCLDDFNERLFIVKKQMDLTTIVAKTTEITKEMYKEFKLNNTLQNLENVSFYPTEYFCPIDYKTNILKITKNTYAIHHYAGSWISKPTIFQKIKILFKNIIKKIIGNKNTNKVIEKRKLKREKKYEKQINSIHSNI